MDLQKAVIKKLINWERNQFNGLFSNLVLLQRPVSIR